MTALSVTQTSIQTKKAVDSLNPKQQQQDKEILSIKERANFIGIRAIACKVLSMGFLLAALMFLGAHLTHAHWAKFGLAPLAAIGCVLGGGMLLTTAIADELETEKLEQQLRNFAFKG